MNSLVKTFSIVALYFLFPFFCFSQPTPKPDPDPDPVTITISLVVDTKNFDPTDWQKSCHFEAKRSDSVRVNPSVPGQLEDFNVNAWPGDIIIWKGKPSYFFKNTVNIKKVKYNKGDRIFKHKDHGSPFWSKKVDAKVMGGAKDGSDYEYDIIFKIKRAKRANGHYKIDPKISIRPRPGILTDSLSDK
ncbi:hypothetical protein [Algibacter mikhailovii]|uniref:Uncharacterized protein n=1 Tax=Algibacter mikhailovii TaxID=425498 RepID=A0A918VBY0_9FLAO|nr:hypothetical protein [Algibacter mikhailovii]GGZ87059.1 hypothetical protein GCM10007028_26490 [Algibacter mikhailovii]